MNGEVPLALAIPVALLLLAGAALTLVGAIGLVRLGTLYERLHAPTLGTSYGMLCIMLASMLYFSVTGARLVLHEIVIGVLVMATTPITLMMVARATLHRDMMARDLAEAEKPMAAESSAEREGGAG